MLIPTLTLEAPGRGPLPIPDANAGSGPRRFALALPRPSLLWGLQPQRRDHQAAWHATPWQRLRLAHQARVLDPAEVKGLRVRQYAWALLGSEGESALRAALRARLAAHGFTAELRDEALACVAAKAQRVLKRSPFDSQLLCAQALMEGHLVEMATGEGKTLAVALAAAASALAGAPVHVMTANDYLAARDARLHAPMFSALGLRVGVIVGTSTPEQRRAAYGADIVYATAREIAFDHLRDGQALQAAGSGGDLPMRAAELAGATPPALLQRGLCCALLDEADSLLIDEAVTPLVLAEQHDDPQSRAACFQALALARQLQLEEDAVLDTAHQSVHWTTPGLEKLEALAAGLGGAWINRQHREDLTAQALIALHALHPQHDYLIEDGRVELLDRLTGRRAEGRVWSRAVQTLVELKEGCKPSPVSHTAAQTSYQRFFARYHKLAGTSGTLSECRRELAAVYGKAVVHVPPRRASLREDLPPRVFEASCQRELAAVRRIQHLQELGRPVLVGVASVAAAQALSAALQAAGVEHQVLDARHEAQEARIIARAGQSSAVTVATALAGRGTDIELGPCVAAMGGLHVLDMLDTPCARTRRQLIGRAARQGDPGSAETWHAADVPCWSEGFLDSPRSDAPLWMVQAASRLQQRLHGWTQRRLRRRLLKQDLSWQRRLGFQKRHA